MVLGFFILRYFDSCWTAWGSSPMPDPLEADLLYKISVNKLIQ